MDSTLMITPGRPASTMRRAVPCATRHAPSRLVPMTPAQSSSVTSRVEAGRAIPELFTTMSGTPSASCTVSSPSLTLPASVTSNRIGCAVPPASRISPARTSSRSMRRAASATEAPCAARVRAKCRPRPLDAPVTSAVRPSRLKVSRCCITGSVALVWRTSRAARGAAPDEEESGPIGSGDSSSSVHGSSICRAG